MVEPDDRLSLRNNPNVTSKIGDEQINFSFRVQKYSRGSIGLFSRNQDRVIMITNIAFYNIDGTEIKRRIKLEDLYGITVSTTSNQFIVHGKSNEYDYLYISQDKKTIIKALQSSYKAKEGNDLLFCKKAERDISKFVISKKEATKNPYLKRINESELSSIQEYIDSQDTSPSGGDDFVNVESQPKPAAQSSKVAQASTPMKVSSNKGKGIPPPPPPPPPPPKVAPIAPSKPSSSKPVDLAAELEAKKSNLQHVEVKDYVSPALKSPEEGGGQATGNSMMAMIMAQRNQMKKVGGTGAPKPNASTASKPAVTRPPGRASAFPTPSMNNPPSTKPAAAPNMQKRGSAFPAAATGIPPKPATSTGPKPGGVSKPTTSTAPKFPAAAKPPTSTGGAKPPISTGGSGGFAAKMAALQARMAGGGGGSSSTSSSTPASTGPSKPIVELCEGNTKRMDIGKLIGNLEKEKKKTSAKSSGLSKVTPVKVVEGKGKGIPPPPPPPPPPPKVK